MLKLNIGSGNTKIEGYTGVDIWPGEGTDVICNICADKLPFEDSSVDHIILSHVIEHIAEKFQPMILDEFWRVLKTDAEIFFAYPEFKVAARHYAENTRGMHDYWKMVIYGRQAHPGDFHVTLMDTEYFVEVLKDHGFEVINHEFQAGCDFNTILRAKKAIRPTQREDVLARELFSAD